MRVFISWSGDRSQALAQALRDWLPLVLHFVEPWLSEADIAAGERWANSVAKELEVSNFGIVCVTRENVAAPWILFEAGSLAKSLEGSKVIPLLLDLEFSEISGPLAQFQAKKVDKVGVAEIVGAINHTAQHPVPDARANQLFEALWPQLEAQVASIPKQQNSGKPIRPQHEVLEELVASIRAIDQRIRSLEEGGGGDISRPSRFKRHRLSPFLLHELPHAVSEGPGDPLGLLVLAGLIRDEIPWLYELAVEAYRSVKGGKYDTMSIRRFRRTTEFIFHSIPPEEVGLDGRLSHMIGREFERLFQEADRHRKQLHPKKLDEVE
jgi:hypothetical protein